MQPLRFLISQIFGTVQRPNNLIQRLWLVVLLCPLAVLLTACPPLRLVMSAVEIENHTRHPLTVRIHLDKPGMDTLHGLEFSSKRQNPQWIDSTTLEVNIPKRSACTPFMPSDQGNTTYTVIRKSKSAVFDAHDFRIRKSLVGRDYFIDRSLHIRAGKFRRKYRQQKRNTHTP